MNKLKVKLCAFCMIFSAIITYSDASSNEYNYKETLMLHAPAIEEDFSHLQGAIHEGEHPLVGDDENDTEKRIKGFLSELGYTPEEGEKVIINTFGSDKATDIYNKLTDMTGAEAPTTILNAALTGSMQITYWARFDDTKKPFNNYGEAEIDADLEEQSINLCQIVKFAHTLRNVGYSATEFLTLYSSGCWPGIDPSTHRCQSCTINASSWADINLNLSSHMDDFYQFVNVLRSIDNDVTYKRMRKAFLYGDAQEKTPDAANADTADRADLFNFLHLFLQEARDNKYNATLGEEQNIAQVVHNWLTHDLDVKDFYPKVVNTLVDMMYIAHVGKNNTEPNATISQVKKHILSQKALIKLNKALENIDVNSHAYRLVGINDLRIGDDAYKVLGLDSSFVNDATSFLLPVAVLQDTSVDILKVYSGAPLLIASDIVYICSQHQLPTVSMFMYGKTFISTYHTGYNLMKQSIITQGVTHNGSYNGCGVGDVSYGKSINQSYTMDNWQMIDTTTLAISDIAANLIVAELFSWYTHILDVSDIGTGAFSSALNNRTEYENAFKEKTKKIPTAHAFIVTGSKEVKAISSAALQSYKPNTVHESDYTYQDNRLLWKDQFGVLQSFAAVIEIRGQYVINSLLNSSWGETMIKMNLSEYSKFKDLGHDSIEISGVNLPMIHFNMYDFIANAYKARNFSSTVHKLDTFKKVLQRISNYTFPGFQPRESAYGRPLAIVKGATYDFAVEISDGSVFKNLLLEDSEAFKTQLDWLDLSK